MSGKAWRLGWVSNGRSGLNLRGWSGREAYCPGKPAGVAVRGAEELGLPLGGLRSRWNICAPI